MMRHVSSLVATTIVVGGMALSACTSAPTGGGMQAATATPMAAPLMDESVPQVARKACLAEVARVTNNPEVAIIEMVFSQANSDVKVGVGPQRAPWRCLVSASGIVASVTSLTDEGRL